MALSNCALTTWSTVQTELGLAAGDQTAAERVIEVASAAIERFCGRHFDKATVTSEKYAATGTNRLVLQRTPIVSITSIYNDGSLVAAADYSIEDASRGFVWCDYGWSTRDGVVPDSVTVRTQPGSGERLLSVTYVGGYITPNLAGTRDLPYELEQACIDTVASLWRRRGVDLRGSGYDGSNTAIGRDVYGIIPGSVIPVLKSYSRIAE